MYSLCENFDFENGLNLLGKCDLDYLELSQNWRMKIPSVVFHFTNLEYLGLNIYETDSIPKEIGKLTKLRSILIGPSNFKYLPPEFANLDSLRTIDISGVTDFDFEQIFDVFSHMNNLQEISLEWGEKRLPDNVAKLKNIKKIILANYPRRLLNNDEINRLHSLLPYCEFVY